MRHFWTRKHPGGSLLEVSAVVLSRFWMEMTVPLLKPPHGSFRIETVTNL
jgi:hypothetical protein